MGKPERAASVAAISALALALGKVTLYWYTGSLVVAISALDSAVDVVVSLINRKTLIFARSSPDLEHPYGHGKAESIAALGQGALLVGASIALVFSALQVLVQHIFFALQWSVDWAHFRIVRATNLNSNSQDTIVQESWFTVLFFLFAALVSLGITQWLKFNASKFNSPALWGDAAHYQGDVYTNIGSAAGLTIVYLTALQWLDPLFGIVFALIVTKSGFALLQSSVRELMDHDVGETLKREVEEFARSVCHDIIDIHNFRGRQSGHRYLFDFHVTLPKEHSFTEVHEKVENLEMQIKAKFNADVVIHADPEPT